MDDVAILASANDPALSGAVDVRNLLVAAGATLDQNQNSLTVSGDLQAPGAIVDGTLSIGGSAVLLEGNFDAIQTGTYTRWLTGPTSLTGDLILQSQLNIVAETLSVAGDLTISGTSGRVYMDNDAAVVDVEGEVRFGGGTHNGYLRRGTLYVAGDFVAEATNPSAELLRYHHPHCRLRRSHSAVPHPL